MYIDLKNKVVMITGSYGDIGHALAKSFTANKMRIALFGRNKTLLEEQAKELTKTGNTNIIIFQGDVTDIDAINSATETLVKKWGTIDVLINNAGITKDNIILRMSYEDWDKVINTNLKGTFNTCKVISKQMIRQKSGKIINISSIVAQIGNKGQTNYVASKAGVDGLTKTLAKELGSRGITVNSIAPGYIKTNMTENLNEKVKDNLLNQIPLNRFGRPEEVASLATFLISKESSYLTGQIINLDGGMITQ